MIIVKTILQRLDYTKGNCSYSPSSHYCSDRIEKLTHSEYFHLKTAQALDNIGMLPYSHYHFPLSAQCLEVLMLWIHNNSCWRCLFSWFSQVWEWPCLLQVPIQFSNWFFNVLHWGRKEKKTRKQSTLHTRCGPLTALYNKEKPDVFTKYLKTFS